MDFPYKLEDIRLIYAFHAFACILVDEKLCTQRCTPKSEGAANFSFCPEVLRCRDHIKLEMNQIVCWVLYKQTPLVRVAQANVDMIGPAAKRQHTLSNLLSARSLALARALRARRARPPEVADYLLNIRLDYLFSCFAAARAACVSTWLGEQNMDHTRIRLVGAFCIRQNAQRAVLCVAGQATPGKANTGLKELFRMIK